MRVLHLSQRCQPLLGTRLFTHTLPTQCIRMVQNMVITNDPYLPGVTETIDVRSPHEFEADHIPGAINLPVLRDSEHIHIGKLYTKAPFEARKQGAGKVTKNISDLIDHYFNGKGEDYSPLIYCKRGGQRSRSLATILSEIGFHVTVLDGGYKRYRRMVNEDMEKLPQKFHYRVIAGMTGTGKTYLLSQLSALGEQVLDLECLAKHKGSVLGLWYKEQQPTQKYFESLILQQLRNFDENKVVWLESESRTIGKVFIPNQVFGKICKSDRYVINLPISERVKHTIRDYSYFTKDFEVAKELLESLSKFHSKEKVRRWISLGEQEKWEELVEGLLVDHYDPTYTLSQTKNNHGCRTVTMEMKDFTSHSVNKCLSDMMEDSRNHS